MRVVYSDTHKLHVPLHDVETGIPVAYPEQPARAERILGALAEDRTFTIEPSTEHGLSPVEAVHAPGLIAFLQDAWRSWQSTTSSPEMFPDTSLLHGLREGMESSLPPEPTISVGRLGYWCFDTGTPIVAGTYAAARGAVDVALTAADAVLAGEHMAYGLCRPPGHHAAHAVYGGFCYFNNPAIAAEYAVRQTGARVAVLDVDYHHGNGTQQIFYRRSDVLYASLHADPLRAFPYFTGHADETGSGPGLGTTFNVPLPPAVTDDQFLARLDDVLEKVATFRAAIVVVSLGMDTYIHDPLGDFNLTTAGYAECGRRVAALRTPLIVLQEGGYHLPDLGENVRQWLRGAATG